MSKAQGTRAEHRTIHWLEARGYDCTRSGGSLGAWDVIALGPDDTLAIQVKYGLRCWVSPAERERLQSKRYGRATKQIWRWRRYARAPEIEVLP